MTSSPNVRTIAPTGAKSSRSAMAGASSAFSSCRAAGTLSWSEGLLVKRYAATGSRWVNREYVDQTVRLLNAVEPTFEALAAGDRRCRHGRRHHGRGRWVRSHLVPRARATHVRPAGQNSQ